MGWFEDLCDFLFPDGKPSKPSKPPKANPTSVDTPQEVQSTEDETNNEDEK